MTSSRLDKGQLWPSYLSSDHERRIKCWIFQLCASKYGKEKACNYPKNQVSIGSHFSTTVKTKQYGTDNFFPKEMQRRCIKDSSCFCVYSRSTALCLHLSSIDKATTERWDAWYDKQKQKQFADQLDVV